MHSLVTGAGRRGHCLRGLCVQVTSPHYEGLMKACDEFLGYNAEKIVHLPCAGGMIVGTETSKEFSPDGCWSGTKVVLCAG
jgi:hypothetical protein